LSIMLSQTNLMTDDGTCCWLAIARLRSLAVDAKNRELRTEYKIVRPQRLPLLAIGL
jgi:hypothetical protein